MFADDYFKFDENDKVFETCRKHCGKRGNCSLRSHSVYKRLVLRTRKYQGLFGKRLKTPSKKPSKTLQGKKSRTRWEAAFPPSPVMFSILSNINSSISITIIIM